MDLRPLLGTALVVAAAVMAGANASGCDEVEPPPKPLQGQVHLTLLHTSDIHSRLYPYNLQLGQIDADLGLGAVDTIANVGGAARMSHIIGRERARATRVLHLDGGDCFQGAPVFNFFSGEAEIRTLVAMGTDAMIIANHEFDRGALNLGLQLQKWASFPVLTANYRFEDPAQPGASPLGSIVVPFSVFQLQGLKVAVVGMGNLSSMTSIFDQPNRLGITPLTTTEIAQFYVDLLRPLTDLVVFVTHLGLEVDEEMIRGTTGIDVVLGGHNHIVLQPPKHVNDCAYVDDSGRNHIVVNGPEDIDPDFRCGVDDECQTDDPRPAGTEQFCFGTEEELAFRQGRCKMKRFCRPRDVTLSHSGAFAKFVGRLDLIVSNEEKDFASGVYDPLDGFEVVSTDYQLFPINENTPEDPIVSRLLEPYATGLELQANLDLLVGYALDGSKRNSTGGGDSPLGNLIATAMWLRLGVKTDFALTNTTGIRADLVPGPVTVEQMYNIFPFDNSISKMQLSGIEVKELFDFVARRSAGRACVSQAQIAGARVVIDCTRENEEGELGVATDVYIGVRTPLEPCTGDEDCPGKGLGSCDASFCWQPIDPLTNYELATSNYLAAGGSGFRVLQRNTTQLDTKVQQRDALIDYIRAGFPCGANEKGELQACKTDGECAALGDGFVCACPEGVNEEAACSTVPPEQVGTEEISCQKGACVLSSCRQDVAAFQRQTCEAATSSAVQEECEKALAPCASAGEQCKFLACIDRRLGNFSDGRLRMEGR
jgi:5'-nucleotidase / UDP-sugar diphosphatase